MEIQAKKKNKWENILNAYVLVCGIIIFSALMTYFVPAGVFDRVVSPTTHKKVIAPESFHLVENTPVTFTKLMSSVPRGLEEAGSIIFLVFIICGAFEVLNKTNFTTSFINVALKKFGGREKLLFPVIVAVFSFFSATWGMAEEVIIFVPILLILCKKLGYDELVAAGLAYCGIRAGHINGMMNPFNVGVAQNIAELPIYSGLWYRSIWCVITMIVTTIILVRYATKIKKDPTQSYMYGVNEDWETFDVSEVDNAEFNNKHKILGLLMIATFTILIIGVIKFGWWFNEMSGLFLVFGIIAGLIYGFQVSTIADYFILGAKGIVGGALIVGVARGIVIVLQDGQIIDPIIFYATNLLKDTPKLIAVNGMYVFQWLLNIIIPSGTAQAATTMPIMVPISDLLGINRQVAVLAFHYGDGVTNLITPACGPLMACLAVARVPFNKWMKWVVPMLIAWTLIGFAAVTVGQLINLGPF
ncbi:MAG: AbgT family transporter [Synergistaceae bacterium]